MYGWSIYLTDSCTAMDTSSSGFILELKPISQILRIRYITLEILWNIKKYCQCFSVNITENTSKYWGCQGFCQDSLAQNQQILRKNAVNIGPNTGSRQDKNSKYWEGCQNVGLRSSKYLSRKKQQILRKLSKIFVKNALNTRKY